MISAPQTYSEWVNILNILKTGGNDDEVLAAMRQGSLEWQSGVAERFSQRLVDAVNSRVNAARDRFSREMGHAYGQERVIIQALLTLRKEYAFLVKAVDLPVIPENLRGQYVALMTAEADATQKSLEDSAKKNDRSGKLLSIIRNHKVNAIKGNLENE